MYQVFVQLLAERGENVSKVAKSTGISESVFSNWKARGGGMSVENLYKIAQYFGVPMETFVEHE